MSVGIDAGQLHLAYLGSFRLTSRCANYLCLSV